MKINVNYNIIIIGRVTYHGASLFTYNPGQSVLTYMNTAFTPKFDHQMLPFYNMSGAAEVCGNSLECLYDIGSTGSLLIGSNTLAAQTAFNKLSMPGKDSIIQHYTEVIIII